MFFSLSARKSQKALIKKREQLCRNKKNIHDALNGDKRGFDSLYQATSKAVYFTCLSLVKNESDAEESYAGCLYYRFWEADLSFGTGKVRRVGQTNSRKQMHGFLNHKAFWDTLNGKLIMAVAVVCGAAACAAVTINSSETTDNTDDSYISDSFPAYFRMKTRIIQVKTLISYLLRITFPRITTFSQPVIIFMWIPRKRQILDDSCRNRRQKGTGNIRRRGRRFYLLRFWKGRRVHKGDNASGGTGAYRLICLFISFGATAFEGCGKVRIIYKGKSYSAEEISELLTLFEWSQ